MLELVTIYHPDKMADFVAESLVHHVLSLNPMRGRAAFEVIITSGGDDRPYAFVYGETTETAHRLPDVIELGHLSIDIFYSHIRLQDNTLSARSSSGTSDQCIIRPIIISDDYKIGMEEIYRLEEQGLEAKILVHEGHVVHRSILGKGDWKLPGYVTDTGVTGRKLACDFAGHISGGGALAGKDMTKIDKLGFMMMLNKEPGSKEGYKYGEEIPNYHDLVEKYTNKMLSMNPKDYVNNWIFSFAETK